MLNDWLLEFIANKFKIEAAILRVGCYPCYE